MKKVKIMLIAITVVAAAGGALAFKSAKLTPFAKVYTCNLNANPRTCSLAPTSVIPAALIPTTVPAGGLTTLQSATVTTLNPAGQPCINQIATCTFVQRITAE